MSGTRSDLTPAANTAMQAREGTRFCHCTEMTFGQAIRARPGDATKPDTEVSWTGRGTLSTLAVYTSIDDGLTWQRVVRSGDPIPNLGFDLSADAPVYSAAHAVTTNRRVIARVVFEGGSAAVLDSLTVRATYEDGTSTERVDTGADLVEGVAVNVRYDTAVGGVVAVPELGMRFFGERGGLTNANATGHTAEGAATGLHLSHGVEDTPPGSAVVVEKQQDGPTRKTDAAMAFEGWFYTEATTGVLCGWLAQTPDLIYGPHGTINNHGTVTTYGLVLELVATDDGAQLRLRCRELGSFPLNIITIISPEDSVQLHRWHHVAFSYDGFWSTLYLDGVVVAHVPLVAQSNGIKRRKGVFEPFGIVISTTGRFTMGRHPVDSENTTTATSFSGLLSEWRFYRQRLTAGDVVQRRFRRLDPEEVAIMVAQDGLAAYYPMNLGNGTACLDYSGHDNHLVWHQQQVGPTRLPTRLAWQPLGLGWRGFPSAPREVLPGILESRDRAPGRETPPIDLDTDGDVIRATDAPFDVVFDGKTFTGVGGLGTIDAVQEAGDLTPTSARLALSGVQPANISLALSARYLDRPCRIWQVTWAEDGTQLDPFLVFDGRIDELNVALGRVGAVEVSAESHLRNWRRPKHRRWNDESQRRLWPDDMGLEFLAEMVDRQVWWPVRVTAADAGRIAVGALALVALVGGLLAWGLG